MRVVLKKIDQDDDAMDFHSGKLGIAILVLVLVEFAQGVIEERGMFKKKYNSQITNFITTKTGHANFNLLTIHYICMSFFYDLMLTPSHRQKSRM